MQNEPEQLDIFISEQFKQNAQNLKKVLEQINHEYQAPISTWGKFEVFLLYLAVYESIFESPSENTVQLLSHPDQNLVAQHIRARCYSQFDKERFREYDYPPGCTFREFQYPTGNNELEHKVTLFWGELSSKITPEIYARYLFADLL